MKVMKMLGIAAVAAVLATVLIGVGSASAWGLCKKHVAPCPEGDRYETGQVFSGALEAKTAAKFALSSEVTCETSGFELKLNSELGSPLLAEMTEATWTNCGSSTVTQVNLPWAAELIDIEGSGRWRVVLKSGGTGNPGVKIGPCTFTAKEIELELEDSSLTGGAAKVIAYKELMNGGCGNEAWTANYRLEPSPIYTG